MKITDIVEDVEPLKQIGLGLGSKALNKIPGFKGKARNMATRADLIKTAQDLYVRFQEYLGTQNRTTDTATGKDILAWAKENKIKVSAVGKGPLDDNAIKAIMKRLASTAMQGKKGTTGGEVSGKVSQTPNAQRKRAARKKSAAPMPAKKNIAI